MSKTECGKRSSYNQFSAGSELVFDLKKISPDGSILTQSYKTQVEAVKGGGFFGQVLLPKDLPFVLKTGIPDPWHDFWRRINWGARDFPYQVSEHQAQLGQITTDLIHATVSPITRGKFYAPKPFGYTSLLGTGTFAQAVEILHGRPPRYDNHHDEYQMFRQAQAEITDIGYKLGLEHVGQVHIDNPFAMANLWRNDALDRWEWFDTLPAMRHTGWVWPFFRFKFHSQIRKTFYPDTKEVTFDNIHTEQLLETVERNKDLFDEVALAEIHDNITLYRTLAREKEETADYRRNFRGLAYAGQQSAIDITHGIVNKAKSIVTTPIKVLKEPTYVDELVLAGVRRALDTNTITPDEFTKAAELVQELSQQERGRNRFLNIFKGSSFWGGLYAYYHISGSLLKIPEAFAYANFGFMEIIDKITRRDISSLVTLEELPKIAIFLGIFAGARSVGGLNSYLATRLTGRKSGRNLNTAAIISSIPFIGVHLAIPAQLCVNAGTKSETILHYTVRNIVAEVSKHINPSGGWGTQLEGRLWNLVGKRIERWVKES